MKIGDLIGGQPPQPETPPVEETTPPAPTEETDPQNPATPPAPVTPPVEGTPPQVEEEEEGSEEGGEGEGQTDEDFYRTLDAMHGEDVNANIDYGDVDPMSAEGVFRREQYIAQKAVSKYTNQLQNEDPRAYAYMLHRQNGGSDESFFETKSFILPEENLLKNDPDLQKQVYHQILVSRGNSAKQADALVKIAVEDGELSKEAETAYKQMKADETKEFENAQRIAQEKNQRMVDDISTFGSILNKSIETNEGLGFNIPAADKDKFNEYLRGKIHYDDGKFFIVQGVDQHNLAKIMEAELFAYLGGNLDKLVTRKATSVAARRTIARAAKDTSSTRGTETPTGGAKTLGSIL